MDKNYRCQLKKKNSLKEASPKTSTKSKIKIQKIVNNNNFKNTQSKFNTFNYRSNQSESNRNKNKLFSLKNVNEINQNTKFSKNSDNNKPNNNHMLSTNETDTEKDEKSFKNNTKNYRSSKGELNEKELNNLNNLFRCIDLKKNIIIDDDGNNNLNIEKQYFMKNINKKFCQNKMDVIKDKLINYNYISKVNNRKCCTLKNNNEASADNNSLFINDFSLLSKTNNNIINNINQGNELIKENKRINEYNKIFNLLNANIEQFKKMINEGEEQKSSIKKNINKSKNNNDTEIAEGSYNISALSHNNNKNNEQTFLESCMQDDFYQYLLLHTSKDNIKDNSSLEFNSDTLINESKEDTQYEIEDDTNNLPLKPKITCNPKFILENDNNNENNLDNNILNYIRLNKEKNCMFNEENKCSIF